MRVLVTGATSLIGRQTVAALRARGHDITALQRSELPGVHTVTGSITDGDAVAQACADQDALIHLAAKVGVVGDWHEYEQTNVDGTRILLDSARESGVQRFVHVSSPSVAHAGEPLIGTTATPADPTHTNGHYSTSKAFAEIAALEASSGEMPVVAIRPHLVWGPGDTQLIGRIVERAQQGRLALIGSGTALIDTTYVSNAADALVAALDHAPDIAGKAFVVSNGEPRTVRELFERIVDAAGLADRPKRVPVRAAMVAGSALERVWARSGRTTDPPITRFLAEQLSTAHWFDQRTTRAALQWQPRISLDEGFERLRASFESNRDDSR